MYSSIPNTISSFKFKGLYRIFCILFFFETATVRFWYWLMKDYRFSMVFAARIFEGGIRTGRIKKNRSSIFHGCGDNARHEIFIGRGKKRDEISGHDEKNTFRIDSICQRAANCVIMPLFCAPKRLDHQ